MHRELGLPDFKLVMFTGNAHTIQSFIYNIRLLQRSFFSQIRKICLPSIYLTFNIFAYIC